MPLEFLSWNSIFDKITHRITALLQMHIFFYKFEAGIQYYTLVEGPV